MKIALVSYEYPPDTGGGGIGTYATNAARMLARRGHQVEVFAGGEELSREKIPGGPLVNRVGCLDREAFRDEVVPLFAERHDAVGFDILEGPEYNAEARGIRKEFPDLPLIVKLHTASCILEELNINRYLTWWDKARFLLGGLARGRFLSPHWTYEPTTDPERRHALKADLIAAPSRSIGSLMSDWWGLDEEKIVHLPNPFEGSKSFLNVDPDTNTDRITFIGRLEVRKGVLDLARAIPRVLDEHSRAQFRFIGRSLSHPKTGEDLRTLIERELHLHSDSFEFTGPVPHEEIPDYLEETDLCVFPSLWENFPNVCLEAMAAARGIVGSRAGGMSEMLDGGSCGHIVDPGKPKELSDAILDLLANPEGRKRLGRKARVRVQTKYSFDAVAPQQESCYKKAISRHHA